MKEFVFTWSIANISCSWHKTGEAIFSPSFIAGPIENSAWSLLLYPRGKFDGDYFSLILQRGVDEYPELISVNLQIYCISADNSPLLSISFTESEKSFAKNDRFGIPRFMKRLEVSGRRKSLYLPEDTLTVCCKMWINESNVNVSGGSFGLTKLDIERTLAGGTIKREIGKETTLNIHSNRQNEVLISIDTLQFEDSIKVDIKPTSVKNMKFCILNLWFVNKSNRQILYSHERSWSGRPQQENWRFPLVCQALDTGSEVSVENGVELLSEFVYSTGEETKELVNEDPCCFRIPELVTKYINSCIPSGDYYLLTMSQDLWNLYKEQVLCDVELKTQTTTFFAHKFVLCARSPVFLAMLTGDMRETRNKCIEIEDIIDDVLGKFLFFLYTNDFEDLEWDAAVGLYYAADKYQVVSLKIVCCSYLIRNISHDNAWELLMLADKHNDSDLKRRVEDFMVRNDEDMFSSPSWKEFVNEQPSLAAHTMILKYDKERGTENDAETYDEKLLSLPNILDDFTDAYKLQNTCDVVIKTTDATFHAHKSVLCAGSAIMRKKFTEDKPTDIFKIPDLTSDIVSRLLFFLHSDSLCDVQWDTAIKLYRAADVYQIQRLKIKCSCFLLEKLETSNASELLLLADGHNDAKLKSIVEDYIYLYDEEIFGSDEWTDFCETNPQLAMETMRLKYRRNRSISLSKFFLDCD